MISASSHPTKTGTAIFRKSAQGTKKVKITCRNSEVLNGYFGLELEDAPDLVADEFGRNFVISACHFDVTVAMDTALGFLEAGKERLGQCLQIGAFLFKTSCDLFARCAMDALVSHLAFPTRKKEVFFRQ